MNTHSSAPSTQLLPTTGCIVRGNFSGSRIGSRITGTRVNALGPVTSHAEQAVGYEHFGTNFAQHAFSRLSSFDLNNSAEGTSQLIGEFIQSVSQFAEGLIPEAYPGSPQAHFGTRAVQDTIGSLSDWFQNGMPPQDLLALLSNMKEGISDLSVSTPQDALSSLLTSIAQLETMMSSSQFLQAGAVSGPAASAVLVAFAAILAARVVLTMSMDEVENESQAPKQYSAESNEKYLSTKQLIVAQRMAKVASSFAVLAASIEVDKKEGKEKENEGKRAIELRTIIEKLGPTYVKVAQAISTRADILSPAYFKEIERLQDRVPTFDDAIAYGAIEKELGKSVSQVFETLSASPVASASLGQVYKGKLREAYGGAEVAVKVQRPGVLSQVSLDLYVMRFLANTVVKSWQKSQTDYAALIDEWAVRFFQEMDYEQEARNAIQFREDMASLEGIVVPEFYPDLCTRKVLVSQWIEGERLSESSAPDVRELCDTLLNAYLIQLLDTGFLHADPHPGNLIRTPEGKICIIDFGLMTNVTKEQRDNLVEYIAKLTTEDWEGVAYALQGLGFIPKGSPDPVESGLVEPLGEVFSQLVQGGGARDMAKRLKTNTDIAKVTKQLDDLSHLYPFKVPTFFTLVLRAFSVIEGIALRVDPSFSIVMGCFPYMSRRLLTDNSPRMNKLLKGMLYGKKQRLDVERLERMTNGLQAFTVKGLNSTSPETKSVRNEGLKDPTVREAILVLFSGNGSYLQDLLVDEMVVAADALSREALSQTFASFLGSSPVAAAMRTTDALGPLRPLVFPFLTPPEVIERLVPAVATTAEDEEALSVVRGIMRLVQQMDVTAQALPSTSFLARTAEDMSPLVPQLAPGVARIGDQFIRRLLSRVLRRSALALESTSFRSEINESMDALD